MVTGRTVSDGQRSDHRGSVSVAIVGEGVAGALRGIWERALRERGRRPWTAAIAWPLATIAAAVALVRLLGLDRGLPLVLFIAFIPYAVLGCVAAAVVGGLARRPVAAGVGALAAVTLLTLVAPRALGSPTPEGGTPLVVMSVNLRVGGADAPSIVELVRDAGVDVLTLQELTPAAEDGLVAAGLGEGLPYRESHPDEFATGSAIFARTPLRDGGVRFVSQAGFAQAYATVSLDDGQVVIVESVHPVPPTGRHWATGLTNQRPAEAPGPPHILAGDFNATLDHRLLRQLLDTGYRDAADAVGAGLTPTWPYYGRRSRVMPRIAIDHVLVPAGIGVRDFRAVTIPRTDHRAIIATLLVPQDPTPR